ncbi:MAG: LPS export ABC transporter periplasmic protein LptC [Nitrospirota bacterium]
MKRILFISLSILIFGCLFLLLRTGREVNGDLHIRTASFLEGIRIVQKENGLTAWTLTADKADFKEGDQKAELKDVALLIQENGMVLHVDKGVYDLSAQSFSTDHRVRAAGKDIRLSADSINYEVATGKIKTDGRIRVEGKGFSVEGKGMQADSEQTVSILNDVKATFHK